MAESAEPSDRCAGCGLAVPGGTAGCQKLMDELVARDFSNAVYFGVHRMLVDTYSLQHPERYCASAKSLAAHLMGLCWLLEHDGNRAVGSEPLRRWLDGTPRLEKPALPAFRGRLTIADVRHAEGPAEHARAVERWARSTWEAYAELHALARQWIEQALAGQVPRRR
jgi:uncharacterized protein DUF5946